MTDYNLEITVGPLPPDDKTTRRLVEIHCAGKKPFREWANTCSYSAVKSLGRAAVDYFQLKLNGQETDFINWLYEYLQQAAEEADQRALKEAAERLIASAQGNQEEPPKPGQGRPVELRVLEPWPEPVQLKEVLDECVDYIRKYVYCQPEQADAVALYLAWTYAFNHFDVLPYLVVTSPTKRCGKTTLLRLILHVANRPLPAVNIRAAGIFRVVDSFRPTLIIDEADMFLESNPELIGVINSGWTRDTAFVIRCDSETGEPRMFCTFSPRVIAAIGRLKDTVEDRAIIITMERRPKEVELARVRKQTKAEGEEIARKYLAWVMDHQVELREVAETEPELPDSLDDRQYENWRPLTVLADLAGGDWPERARRGALWTSGAKDEVATQDIGIRLLADIREVFGDDETLTSTVLISRLAEIEEAPWATYSNGKPISPHKVASLLKRFGVKPIKREKANCYRKSDFSRVWGLYLQDQSSRSSSPVVSDYPAITYKAGTLMECGVENEQSSSLLSDYGKTTYDSAGTSGTLNREKRGRDDEYEEFTV